MDKRHMTLYIPLLFIMQLFVAPDVETLDNTILLSIELVKFTNIIRKDSFNEDEINDMVNSYKRYLFCFFISMSY